jgi:hypothetical protein
MMNVTLKDKIDSSLISPKALFAAEQAGEEIQISLTYTRSAPRRVWDRQALLPQSYVQFATGKAYGAIKKWQQRGHLMPVKMIGTAPLFDVAFVEHLLQTESFAVSDDELCEAAWMARAFWTWVPRDGLEVETGSPAERIANMPFMPDLYTFVEERLKGVAALRRAAQVEAERAARKRA